MFETSDNYNFSGQNISKFDQTSKQDYQERNHNTGIIISGAEILCTEIQIGKKDMQIFRKKEIRQLLWRNTTQTLQFSLSVRFRDFHLADDVVHRRTILWNIDTIQQCWNLSLKIVIFLLILSDTLQIFDTIIRRV